MQDHLDKSKNRHLEITASKCQNLEVELTDFKLALNKIAPKPVFNPPPDIVMDKYERRKNKNERCYSPPFYTHVGGYKMCLSIDANGWGDGKGTHVGVGLFMMKGEFDSHLKWPLKGGITVELVNQKDGGVKYERKLAANEQSEELVKVFQRVTEGERATSGFGYSQFISHTDLYKPEEDKEYLLNDTLIFRVTIVEVANL